MSLSGQGTAVTPSVAHDMAGACRQKFPFRGTRTRQRALGRCPGADDVCAGRAAGLWAGTVPMRPDAPWTQLPNVWAEGSFRDRDAPGVLTGPNSVRHGFRRHVAADLEEAAACGTCVSSRRRAPAAFESRGDAPVSAGLSARGWALGAKLQPQRHVRRQTDGGGRGEVRTCLLSC